MKKIIEYKHIPDYCDLIDKDKRSAVILSKFQAGLYRQMKKNHPKSPHGAPFFFCQTIFFANLICILIFARNLLLLEYFYRHNEFNSETMEFMELENGKVMLVFNPNAKQDFEFD